MEEIKTIKGFHVFATDGFFVELPNHLQTREKMKIPPYTEFESYVAMVKIFCMADTKWTL